MKKYNISAVEQPVAADDIEGLKHVADSAEEAVMADESLSSVKEAEELAKHRACDIFNIRLSKCGGLLAALKILDIAKCNSIQCQLGCHVGESAILSSAGRHFACCVGALQYLEGSYGEFLLKEDVAVEDITFGRGGLARAITGTGLGINVRNEILDKYTTERFVIE